MMTFEKIHGEAKWQARIDGEFVCYIKRDGNGDYYNDLDGLIVGKTKSAVLDKFIEGEDA